MEHGGHLITFVLVTYQFDPTPFMPNLIGQRTDSICVISLSVRRLARSHVLSNQQPTDYILVKTLWWRHDLQCVFLTKSYVPCSMSVQHEERMLER
jgi:hypothetical protein